jgi:hypothetical protein
MLSYMATSQVWFGWLLPQSWLGRGSEMLLLSLLEGSNLSKVRFTGRWPVLRRLLLFFWRQFPLPLIVKMVSICPFYIPRWLQRRWLSHLASPQMQNGDRDVKFFFCFSLIHGPRKGVSATQKKQFKYLLHWEKAKYTK